MRFEWKKFSKNGIYFSFNDTITFIMFPQSKKKGNSPKILDELPPLM